MTELITGILTFIGTVGVAGLGFWQWRKGQIKDDRKAYRTKRVETLTSVWDELLKIEKAQRQALASESKPLATEHVTHVNLLLMSSAPFLLDEERLCATSIVQHVVEIDAMMRSQRQSGDFDDEWWAITAIRPGETSVVAIAASRLSETKKLLRERYAAVMKGEHE